MREVDSPCVRNCCLDENDVCLGCFRHVDEIVRWREMSAHEKEDVIKLTAERRALHRCRYLYNQ